MLTRDTRSPYVDYPYYRDAYHGKSVKADEFQNAEIEAEAFVNAVTFGRIRKLDSIPDCVKLAICSAVEVLHQYTESHQSQIHSESNDGYSVTYAEAVTDSECKSCMKSRVKRHLANTGLMYKGWLEEYDE